MSIPNLLVGAHGGLVEYHDGGHRLYSWADDNKGHYDEHALVYGMTRKPDGDLIIAVRRWMLGPQDPPDLIGTQLINIDASHSDLRVIGRVTTWPLIQVSDVHQILYADAGLYVTDTIRNQIVWVKDNGKFVSDRRELDSVTELMPGDDDIHAAHQFEDTSYDISHPNSIYSFGDDRIAVLLHHRYRKPSEVVYFQRDGCRFLELDRYSLPHEGCHNLLFDGDYLYYNASDDGKLVHYHIPSGTVVREWSFLNAHTKGLVRLPDGRMAVGVSERAKYVNRFSCNSAVCIFDASVDNPEMQLLDIGDNRGNVNEIMVR